MGGGRPGTGFPMDGIPVDGQQLLRVSSLYPQTMGLYVGQAVRGSGVPPPHLLP